jgi:phospho-N-acetylmuramoyl-pentapeptide-transferase
LLAGATGLVLGLALTSAALPVLRRLGVRERADKSDSPFLARQHGAAKSQTPTLGGIPLLLAFALAALGWADPRHPFVLLLLGTALAFAVVGFLDDLIKLTRPKVRGLRARPKLVLQLLISAGAGLALLGALREADPSLLAVHLPVLGALVPLAPAAFVALATVTTAASTNGVNLTDGLDGLAGGCFAIAGAALAGLALLSGTATGIGRGLPAVPGAGEAGVAAAALVGAVLGFLWFNCHPARVFMGNTGSLALGGALGVLALIVRQEPLLLVVGGVFVLESVSVILQVLSFRWTGRRIFRCAPLHHHFEFLGWPETRVTARFWLLGTVLALSSLAVLRW